MLTVYSLKGSSKGVSDYLTHNQGRSNDKDYYRDGESAPSHWQGRGAEMLGLSGEVDPETFKKLLESGPDGMEIKTEDRRMGADLHWSVPKSVSMLIEAAPPEQREQILELCREANQLVVQHIEDHIVTARYGKGGAVAEKTGTAIFATFEHDDARPTENLETGELKVDMDTHFHNALLNATWDGKEWRSLDLDFGALSVEQHLGDAKGKAYLAAGLERMGIAVERNKDAGFEIAGISRDQILQFSDRSKEIEKALADKGLSRETSTGAERNTASLKTRNAKMRDVSHDDLRWEWRSRLRDAGVNFDRIYDPERDQTRNWQLETTLTTEKEQQNGNEQQFFKHTPELHPAQNQLAGDGFRLRDLSECTLDANFGQGRQGPGILPDHAGAGESKNPDLRRSANAVNDGQARAAVDAALDHLSEKDSLFDRRQLHLEALKQGMGQVDSAAIEQVMASHDRIVWAGEQVKEVEQKRPGKDGQEVVSKRMIRAEMVTTVDTVRREGWIQGFVQDGQGKLVSIFQQDQADTAIQKAEEAQGFTFSADQRQALQNVLTSDDRVTAIIGGAGTGKTTVMKSLVDNARDQGFETIGLTPSHGARQELLDAGTDSNITTAKFIAGKEEAGGKPRLFILDEAGMVGDKSMQAVLQKMGPRDRLLLSGDPDQMKPVEAGDPLKTLEEKGLVHVSRLTEVRRQAKAEDKDLLALGQAWADRDTEKALNLMGKHVHEVPVQGTGPNDKSGHPKITTEDRRAAIADAAVNKYLERNKKDRDRTMIICPTNAVRQQINDGIRGELQERGELAEDKVTVTQLVKADISEKHMTQAEHYKEGQILRTNEGKGKDRHTVDYAVVGMDARKNTLLLENSAGLQKTIRADHIEGKKWQLFDQKNGMGMAEGDKLIFRDNSIKGAQNGDAARIQSVDGDKITVLMDKSQKTVELDARKNLAVDYGYARTIHDSQGKSPDLVIMTDEASGGASRNLKLVGTTRMRYGLEIVTDDKKRTIETARKEADKNIASNARKNADQKTDRRLDRLDRELQIGKEKGRDFYKKEPEPEIKQAQKKQQEKTHTHKPYVPKKKKEKNKEKDMGMELEI